MAAPRTSLTHAVIYEAFDRFSGNKSAMADALGVHRQTLHKLMREMDISDKPLVAGRIRPQDANVMPLPPAGKIKRYLLTSAQNNTAVFSKFLNNLIAYKKYLSRLEGLNAELMISRFSYNKTAFENSFMAKPGKGPTDSDFEAFWYDPAIAPYVCDSPAKHGSCRYQLAPDLHWCAELNVIPTAERPLSGMDTYAGNSSAIFPHAKVALRSMPRMQNEDPRFLYTTGTVTTLNYIQRKAGQKAEFHHVYGALLVEVDSDGNWWARQINADRKGEFYDCPRGRVLRVSKDTITTGLRAEAINWGDVHASEIDTVVQEVNWGKGGAIDALRPKHQIYNDLFSMRSRSHHEMKQFGAMYEKFLTGNDSVSEEVNTTCAFMHFAHRDWCKTVVVSSNHDRHGERWLDEADYKHDLPNVEFFLEAQLERVRAIKAQRPWSFLEWALLRVGCPQTRFLPLDASYIIGPRHHQIECGLHGDLGPDGSRGTTRNLGGLGRRNTKGHDHRATIDGPTYSAGVCQLKMSYSKGPTTWSISHVVTWPNGKRCIVTQRADKLWA